MKSILSILFLSFSISIYSQSFETLFQEYIPEVVQKDKQTYHQVIETLKRDALLNPTLIYYRLKYYKLLFNENIKDNKKNGFNDVRSLVSQYILERNTWLKNQIKKAGNYKKRSDFTISTKLFFKEKLTEIYVDDSYSPDDYPEEINQADFFALIFLTGNNRLQYDEIVDYSVMRKEVEQNKATNLYFIYNQLLNQTEINIDNLENEIIKYWYLFPVAGTSSFEADAYELFIKYLENLYSSKKLDQFTLFLGGRYLFITEKTDLEILPQDAKQQLVFGESFNSQGLTLQLDYKFHLAETIRSFSYINIGMNLSFNFSPDKSDFKTLIYARSDISGKDFTSGLWNLSTLDVSNAFISSGYLKASIPVLFIGTYLSLEVGFMAGVSYLTYDATYSYEFTQIKVDWNEENGGYTSELLAHYVVENETETRSQTDFRIYPSVDLTWLVAKPINLQLSAGYNFAEVKVGVSF